MPLTKTAVSVLPEPPTTLPDNISLALALKGLDQQQSGLPIPASLVDQTGIKLLIRVNAPQG
ncbi:MAG: hypothetical protein U0T74_11695 [Chitinophagales bacterium]